jgi:hypothetical protein
MDFLANFFCGLKKMPIDFRKLSMRLKRIKSYPKKVDIKNSGYWV